jgi:GAF domain-containing protein/HAMP domain-containing protein
MINTFLRRMTVRRRIVGSFLVLLIFLTLFVPLTITDHLSLTDRVEQLVNVNARSNQLLLSALADILSSRVNLMRYADDLTPSVSDALNDISKAMDSIEEARSLVIEPEQKSAMANILAGLVSYNTLITNVQTARIENRQQDVTTLLSNSYQLEFDLEQQIRAVVNTNVTLVNETNRTTLSVAQQRLILLVASYLIALLLAIAVAVLVQQSITRPVSELREGAETFQRERRATSIPSEGTDELSLLAQTINQITSELSQTLAGLEQRVAERTKALASVAEISTSISTVLETDELLQRVVDLAKERFDFYHAHIYVLNEAGDTLVLASGAGDVGRQMVTKKHSISLDREQSLVARAAREKKGVTINDVTTTPDFLPNPLLPNTRSEMAVPMIAGERVVGVFDVQSEVVGRFTDADIAIQTTLASQVASAVQTARSYAEIQRNEALLSDALSISRLANWEYDLEQDLFTFNDNFYSIFRTTAENVGGYRMSSADYARRFVHPEDAPLVGIEIQKALDSKERSFKAAVEHRTIFADGQIGFMTVRINVERDENGKIVRWYGANQDITERHRLEEINRKRAIQQETLNVITQKIQGAATIEEAMQITAREMGHALGMKPTLVTLEPGALVSGSEGN